MNFRMKIFAAMAFVLIFSFTTLPQAYALEYEDGCEDVPDHQGADIKFLRASFLENEEGPEDDEIRVELELCDSPLGEVKYRLRLAHDKNDDISIAEEVAAGDVCEANYNKGMMYKDGRDFGPGSVTPDGNSLIFSLDVDELEPSLEYGDSIYLKADTQYRGILDRVPGKDKELEGCERHYLEFVLVPDVPDGVCPCFNANQLSDWNSFYMPTELDIIRDPDGIFYSADANANISGFDEVEINVFQCTITDLFGGVASVPDGQTTINFENDQDRDACIGIFLTEFPSPPPE